MINQIAQIFQNNLGNKLTVELANGMIMEIAKTLPKVEEINDDNTATDTDAQ